MLRRIFLFPLSMFVPFCLHAQTNQPSSLVLPTIRSIQYEGLVYISPTVANEIIDVKIGDQLDLEKIDRSIMKFHKQGYFEDIWVTEDQGVLTYHFKEKPAIANIEINGYGNGTDKDAITKEIGVKKGDVYDAQKVDRIKQKVASILEAKGYYDTVIEVQTEKLNDRAVKLIIDVNQGEEIIIKKTYYHGAKSLSTSQIESATVNREEDFIGWMWGFNDGKLHVNELANDARRIKDYYMRKGFLDAQVNSPLLQADFNTYEATLSFNVDEGQIYYVGGVDIILDEDVIDRAELMDALSLFEGKRFNIETVRKDIERMKEKIGDLGYAFVRIDPQLDSRKEEGKVDITYDIQVGHKVKIGNVIISGNTRTLDRVIRREVVLSPGDYYEHSKVRISRNNLRQLGFFDSVEIEEKRVDEDTLDLFVNITEGRTGEFMFGVGYGSYDGLLGNISVRERNAFGSGMSAGVYIDASQKEQAYRLDIYNPRILDSRYSVSADIYKRDYITYDYTERSKGVSVSLGRRFFDYVHATLGYSYVQTELTNFLGGLAEIYQPYFMQGVYDKSSIIPGINFDSTDDYYFPRNGVMTSAFVEFAGVGGDEKFIKYFAKFAGYTNLDRLDDVDVIFRLKARAGVIDETGYLPINEKFYLGGISSLRGYRSNSVTPFDANWVRIGGKYMAAGSTEVSFGLFETVQMRLTVFVDYGMIGQNSFSEIIRYSTGAGIEWVSPLGPINFIFPYAINPQPEDKTSRFEFSFGSRF